jgi:hypothetical protein
MRLGAFILLATTFALPAVMTAQDYSAAANRQRATSNVLRPAETVAWRNYVTVPDGPCGCPMSVEADCYNEHCPHCNPFRFLRRVGRMLDCLKPCNLCCATGGCGLIHGGKPGHCSICCGVACSGCGGCGQCGSGGCQSGCCPNPCGSAFSAIPSCTCGGHCHGCSSALPALNDPFVDDPPLPKPTSEPSSEVRRTPAPRVRNTGSHTAANAPAPAPRPTPYKVVNANGTAVQTATRPESNQRPAARSASKQPASATSQSVLRRASAEEAKEPAPLFIDRSTATPINQSSKPDRTEYAVPSNPLR